MSSAAVVIVAPETCSEEMSFLLQLHWLHLWLQRPLKSNVVVIIVLVRISVRVLLACRDRIVARCLDFSVFGAMQIC